MAAKETTYKAKFFSISTSPDDFIEFANLRKTIFVEQERWQLEVDQNLEIDELDHFWSNYCVLSCKGTPIGGFRAIRWDKPNLLRSKFSHLSPGDLLSKNPNDWEISRFGLLKPSPPEAGTILYALIFEFARWVSAGNLLALTDLKHERLLKRLRVHTERFCDPVVVGLSKDGLPLEAVAGRIPVHTQNQNLIEKFSSLLEGVSINDHRHVFGSHIISA